MTARIEPGMVRLSRYGRDKGKPFSGREKPLRTRKPNAVDQSPVAVVTMAALAAQTVLRECADSAGVAIDTKTSARIRLCVVRGIYCRFVDLAGLADSVGVDLPPDTEVAKRFLAALDPIAFGNSELLSCALEPLADADDKRARGAHFTPRTMASDIVAKTLEPLFRLVPPANSLDLRVCDPAVGGGVFLLELVSQIADRLVACGRVSDLYVARRLAAIHCAYGVDIDPVSVECTKLALRLECRAQGMPANWLDGNIKHGDALVGLTGPQLRAGHWHASADAQPWLSQLFDQAIELGAKARLNHMSALSALAQSTGGV